MWPGSHACGAAGAWQARREQNTQGARKAPCQGVQRRRAPDRRGNAATGTVRPGGWAAKEVGGGLPVSRGGAFWYEVWRQRQGRTAVPFERKLLAGF
jgi:hypothetical protein